MTGATAVGIILVLPVFLIVVETVGYRGSPFGKSAFWRLSLDEKLDLIVVHERAWRRTYAVWLPQLGVMTAGMAGVAYLLADPIAWVGFGLFVVGVASWLMAATITPTAMTAAARVRQDTGETPAWVHPFWQAGWVQEVTWVVAGNLAGAAYGASVVRTGLLPHWLGWAVVAVGLAEVTVATITREVFPHMVLPIPIALGIALLVS